MGQAIGKYRLQSRKTGVKMAKREMRVQILFITRAGRLKALCYLLGF